MKILIVIVVGAMLMTTRTTHAKSDHAITIYSSAAPGSISPDLYRPVRGRAHYDPNGIPGYAMVRHRRSVVLGSGTSILRFTDVAALIDPTTVYFESLTDPKNTRVVEQNFQFDLVGTQKLLEKYIDQKITVERVVGDRLVPITGTLMSAIDGLVIKDDQDQIQVIRNYGNIVFPELPGGLITKPTLEWQVIARKAGEHVSRVSYQTSGMTWWTDYNLVYNDGGNANTGFVDVGAWVSIINQSGASYPDTKLKLIAGDVHRAQPNVQKVRRSREMAMLASADSSAGFDEKTFFEFHLYTLGRSTTLPDNSTKQIQLFATAERVPARKILVYYGAPVGFAYGGPQLDRNYGVSSNKKVDTYLEFKNEKSKGLGIPLPAGRIRVSKLDTADDTLEFIGEDIIDHTPKNEDVLIKLGSAFDVIGERKQVDFQVDSKAKWMEEEFEIEIRNRKKETVDVIVKENLHRWVSWKIIENSHKFIKQDARTVHIPVRVGADEELKVSYRVRYTW